MIEQGYDTVPDRSRVATAGVAAFVVAVAAALAVGFRSALEWILDLYGGAPLPTEVARKLPAVVVFVLVATAVIVAAELGRSADRVRPGGSGLAAIAASARGEPRRLSSLATALRVTGIAGVAAGLVSLGREAAIVESGGAVGAAVGRRTGGKGDAMAVAGIAAAFAAAYHAPLAAAVYVEEHLGVRRSRRAVRFTVAGALGGHLVAYGLVGAHPILPPIGGSRWALLAGGLAVTVPATVVARVFFRLRTVAADDRGWRRELSPRRLRTVTIVAALVAAGTVAVVPWAAGNGMDALAAVPTGPTFALAGGLLVGKLVGTTAALVAGAPGGVIFPSMAITGGAGLLVALTVDSLGRGVAHPWDLVVAAMVPGIAIGLRSPFMSPLLVAELVGDYTLVPALAVIALVAHLLDRLIDRTVARSGVDLDTLDMVRDEDA